jgi:hypothetical protein
MRRDIAARLLHQALRAAPAESPAALLAPRAWSRREWLAACADLLREAHDHELATAGRRPVA